MGNKTNILGAPHAKCVIEAHLLKTGQIKEPFQRSFYQKVNIPLASNAKKALLSYLQKTGQIKEPKPLLHVSYNFLALCILPVLCFFLLGLLILLF